MARWAGAIWHPVSQFSGTLRPVAVTLHHQAGNGNPASVYASRGVSAHFWLPKSGTPVQHVDTANRSWHGGTTHNDHGIGVETEGCGGAPHAEPLTPHQVEMFAALMRWAAETHGVPLKMSEHASAPGLNYHRCPGGTATACPCDVRLAMRPAILSLAGGSSAPVAPAPPSSAPGAPQGRPGGTAPPWPGRYLKHSSPLMSGEDVHAWQSQMHARGWAIARDGFYGSQSAGACEAFQREKGLAVDGIVGPATWAATWEAPIT